MQSAINLCCFEEWCFMRDRTPSQLENAPALNAPRKGEARPAVTLRYAMLLPASPGLIDVFLKPQMFAQW